MNKSVFAIFLAAILIGSAFAQQSFAENSKCDGDCEAPTLGSLDDGKRLVEGGLVINGQAFDITGFTQTIPTQMLVVGQPVTVKLTIYENSGTSALRYASFAVADYNGERDQTQKARIAFMQNFDGIQKLDVLDFDKMLSNVKYTATAVDSFTTVIEFSFEFATPVQKSDIIIEAWDDSRSSRKNVLMDAIQVDEKSMEKVKEEKMMEKKIEKKTPAKVEKEQKKEEKKEEKSKKKPQVAKGKKKTKLRQQYQ